MNSAQGVYAIIYSWKLQDSVIFLHGNGRYLLHCVWCTTASHMAPPLPHPTPSDDLSSPETSQNITSHTLSGHTYDSTNYHVGHNALKLSKVQWHDMVDVVGCGTFYTSLEHFRFAVNSLLQLISSW